MRNTIGMAGSFFKLRIAALFCFVLALGMYAPTTYAQDYRAKLTVTVMDSTGAVVPNAALELKRGSTNTTSPAKSDALGVYVFQFLEPDTYTVFATAQGMNKAEVHGIVLQSFAATSIDVRLKPASDIEQVVVTDEPALLETESATRAFNIENETIKQLPVINGNTVMLGNDLPGVYMRPLGIYTDPWTVTSQFLINGGLMYLNEFMIDGSPNDAELGGNTYAYTPPQFSTKEFSVSANNYDAQYGHTSGGVIEMATLSGAAKYHGMGWSSLRRTDWNANTTQNKFANWLNNTTTNTRPFNEQTQLGFQAGGPLAIPRVLPKSNSIKPFFFVAFDHYTELLPRGLLLSYPTTKMRTGDFSELLNQPGYQAITIDDPASVHQNASGVWVRDQFPGNVIPTARLDPVAVAIAKLLPTVGNTASGQRIGTNNLTVPNNYYNWHFRNLLGRFDVMAGDKYKFFVRPFAAKFDEVSNAGAIVGAGENGGNFSRASRGFLADFVDVVNPSTVLNVRYGYTRFSVVWTSPENNVSPTTYGMSSAFAQQLQDPKFFGQFTFSNYSTMGWFANTENTGTYSLEDDISKTKGRHTIRIGSDLRLTKFHFFNPGTFAVGSDTTWTQDTYSVQDTSAGTRSGDSFASFLLGLPSSGNANINANELISTWYLAPWIQDDWRVTPKLTMGFGFRYDVLTGPTDAHDALVTGFDPNVSNAVQSQMPGNAASILPAAGNLTGGLTYAGVNGSTRAAVATVYHNIQPRFGFAWSPTDRIVVRGGYGLFYTNFQSNGMLQQNGFSATTPLVATNDGGIHPITGLLSNPFPNGLIQPAGSSLGTATGVGTALSVYNHNYKIPSANEFSFGIQYRITKSSVLDASFVGNRVVGYDMNYNANYPTHSFLQTCSQAYGPDTSRWGNCWAQQGNPFQGVAAFKGTDYYSPSTYQAWDMNRPHPQFHDVTVAGMNGGKSYYNGLQVNFHQRMSHGVSFDTNYAWSKQIEQWGWLSQDLNLRQRSVYYLGLPQVFKINGVVQVPVGKGRMLNLHNNRIADAVVGGWDFSPQLVIQSGEPIAMPGAALPLASNKYYKNLDWKQQRVQGWTNCVMHHIHGSTDSILNPRTGCQTLADANWMVVDTLWNEAINNSNSGVMHMKTMVLSDAAISKSVDVRDGVKVSVRLSASNVLNHFNILTARFNNNPWDQNFGTIVPGQTASSDSPPRNVNVQIRVTF
ncbi:MAG: carboxypeptidase regulatory-like domain-containing protein [Acidobacteriaceae bacterium]|nr:carboxypeptidase regulatory-like domain-containing protein [Acidobacteriaceae bacterium]